MTKNQIVVHLENIVVDSENKSYLIGKRFTSYKDYYEYPFSSSLLDIFSVNHLSESLESWPLNEVKTKVIILPCQKSKCDDRVCFPLLHTFIE